MRRGRALCVALTMVASAGLAASRPAVVAGELVDAARRGALRDDAARAGASGDWVGWTVPKVAPEMTVCCCDWDHGRREEAVCSLESRSRCHGDHWEHPGRVPWDTALHVLMRFDDREPSRLRALSESCRLHAPGQRIQWLGEVDPAESSAWLGELVAADDGRLRSEALAALALHDDAGVDRRLEALLAEGGSVSRDAAFWLGEVRGEAGYGILVAALAGEPEARRRKELVFPLSRSEVPEAMAALGRLAADDPAPAVRKEALFWLAQEGGAAALPALRRAATADDDPAVRKHAVFALTQLPDGAGRPLLAELALGVEPLRVRKEAIFWLAQEGGDEALDVLRRTVASGGDEELRRHALFAATQVPDGGGIPLLAEVARDPSLDLELRRKAIFWLGQSDEPAAHDVLDEIFD